MHIDVYLEHHTMKGYHQTQGGAPRPARAAAASFEPHMAAAMPADTPRLLATSNPGSWRRVYKASLDRIVHTMEASYGRPYPLGEDEEFEVEILRLPLTPRPLRLPEWQYAAHMIWANIENHRAPEVLHIIKIYLMHPTPDNASQLLEAMGLPIPLASLLANRKRRRPGPAPQRQRFHDGDGVVRLDPSILDGIVATNTLHDVLAYENNVSPAMREWIIAQQNTTIADLWIENADAFYWSGLHSQERFTEPEDQQLWATFQEWASRPQLSMIFDGLCTRADVDIVVHSAVIMMLFHNGSKLLHREGNTRMPMQVKELRIYSGYFENLNRGAPLLPFLQGFVNQLAIYTKKAVIYDTITDERGSIYLPSKYYTRTAVRDGGGIVLPSGATCVYKPNQEGTFSRKQLTLPFCKHSMALYFDRKIRSANFDEAMAQHLRNIMELGFFRDAYTADVALQKGCVLVTNDRLAFVFYTLLALANGLRPEGLYANLQGGGKEARLEMGVYRPVA